MEHAPHNVTTEAGEVERFRDRGSELMGALLDELARVPDVARTFPEVEAALGWPRRRIASVLGGVAHVRHTEFAGRRPYHLVDARDSGSGRWEIWMDADQAAAVRCVTCILSPPPPAAPPRPPAGGRRRRSSPPPRR